MIDLRLKSFDAADQTIEFPTGVHVGEVELVGAGVRVAVHEAARIMAEAAAGEILVSDTTRLLAQPSGFRFEGRGPRPLEGSEGEDGGYTLTWRCRAGVTAWRRRA